MLIPILIIGGIVLYEWNKKKQPVASLPPAAPAVIDNIALTSGRTWTTVEPGSIPAQRFDGMFTGIRTLAPSPNSPIPQDWGNRAIYYGGYPTITGPQFPTYVGQIQNPVLRDYIGPTLVSPPTQFQPVFADNMSTSIPFVNAQSTEQSTVPNSAGNVVIDSGGEATLYLPPASVNAITPPMAVMHPPIVPSAPITPQQIANPFNPVPAVVGQPAPFTGGMLGNDASPGRSLIY